MESVYNNKNEVGDIIANLKFPQKYITLEYEGVLFNLELVSVDDFEFVVRVVGEVSGGRE